MLSKYPLQSKHIIKVVIIEVQQLLIDWWELSSQQQITIVSMS